MKADARAILASAGVAALLLLVAWLAWPRAVPAPRQDVAAVPAPLAAVSAAPVATAGEGAALQRSELATTPAIPPDPLLGAVPPWSVTLRVLDASDATVEAATVEVFAGEARRVDGAAGEQTLWLGCAEVLPLQTLTTAYNGDVSLCCQRQRVYVRARHPLYGASVVHGVDAGEVGDMRIVRLWLHRPVLVRGTVLDGDGAPLPFAQMSVNCPPERRAPTASCLSVGSFASDALGRFCFEASAGVRFEVRARSGERTSMTSRGTASDGAEVVVAFAGALAVCGRVVDADGLPVAGAVVHIRATDQWPLEQASYPARLLSEGDGSFVLPVADCGSYVVNAGDPGSPLGRSPSTVVSPSLLQRRPFVELRLQRPQTLRGRVRFADGAVPGPGKVWAEPAGASAGEIEIEPVEFAVDGTFALSLPPGRRWQLLAMSADADGELALVPSAQHDVEVEIRPRRVAVELRGEVVTDCDGAPVPRFELWWVQTGSGKRSLARPSRKTGNGFELADMPSGDGWLLMARAVDKDAAAYGTGLAGPFARSSAPGAVVLRLPKMALLPVRVVDRSGQPRPHLLLAVESGPAVDPRSASCGQGDPRTDAEGRARFLVDPGRARLRLKRGYEELVCREVDVVPGANPELVLQVTQ